MSSTLLRAISRLHLSCNSQQLTQLISIMQPYREVGIGGEIMIFQQWLGLMSAYTSNHPGRCDEDSSPSSTVPGKNPDWVKSRSRLP